MFTLSQCLPRHWDSVTSFLQQEYEGKGGRKRKCLVCVPEISTRMLAFRSAAKSTMFCSQAEEHSLCLVHVISDEHLKNYPPFTCLSATSFWFGRTKNIQP